MPFDIIDFHTHPFYTKEERIGGYVECVDMSIQDFLIHMQNAGVSSFCGSVIGRKINSFENIKILNRHALSLCEIFGDRYIPGFHVHPFYIEESISEIDFAIENNIKYIGELVPYHHGWEDYSNSGFLQILEYMNQKGLPLNIHIGSVEDLCRIEKAIERFQNMSFILAHPGYGDRVGKHIEILKKYDNAYLDLSGGGIELFGQLKYIVEKAGYEKLIFGTDFPVSSVGACIENVLSQKISDKAKECILGKNANILLKLK